VAAARSVAVGFIALADFTSATSCGLIRIGVAPRDVDIHRPRTVIDVA
jgi:hypothetical protein